MQELTAINRYTTKKDGSALMTSKGKPYTSVRIKTVEHGDKLISGFGNSENALWKVGDKVDILIEQNGEYLNFSMPRRDAGPAANNGATAEIKNILEFGVIERLKKIEFLIQAVGDRVERLVEPNDDPPLPSF